MDELLVISLLILANLVFLVLILKKEDKEHFGEFKVSKIGKISQMFPRRCKGITIKKPIQDDKIVDVQEVDVDVVRYLYD